MDRTSQEMGRERKSDLAEDAGRAEWTGRRRGQVKGMWRRKMGGTDKEDRYYKIRKQVKTGRSVKKTGGGDKTEADRENRKRGLKKGRR